MAHYVYENKVIQNKYESILKTKLDINNYLTVDHSLESAEGDDVEIYTRSVEGNFQDVAMGEGNTQDVEVTGTMRKYTVKTKQGRFTYFDEQARKDSLVVDTGLKGMVETSVNAWTAEAIAEYEKAYTKNVTTSSLSFDDFVDAVALFGEDGAAGLTALINPEYLATLRKNLKDDLKYVEGYVRTGYIGHVAGVPVVSSNVIPKGEVIISKKEAVTLFLKKASETEQEREPNLRKNIVYMRKVAITALTKESSVVRIAAAATTTTTITAAKAQKTITGAATTGANVRVYLNDTFLAETAAASSAYTVTAEKDLAAGDRVLVIAQKPGQVASYATVTVA